MTSAAAPSVAAPRRGGAPSRVLEGLTWRGIALVAIVCLVNGLRRKSMYRPGVDESLVEWSAGLATMFGLSLVVALPVTLAVVAACNRALARPVLRYPAVAAAVVLSSIGGAVLAVALEHALVAPVAYVDRIGLDPLGAAAEFLKGHWLRYGLLAAFGSAIYVYTRVADAAAALAREADLDRERLDQQMQEARLQMLQAQIEPHRGTQRALS